MFTVKIAGTGWSLEMEEIGQHNHRITYCYAFKDEDRLIFAGREFSHPMVRENNEVEAAIGLLGFLSLRPSETDAEFVEDYTPEQIAWADKHGDDLSCYVSSWEDPDESCGYYMAVDHDEETNTFTLTETERV